MKVKRYLSGQHKVCKIRGHGAALHVAIKMDINRGTHVFCNGAKCAAQLTVAGAAIAGLDALECGAQLCGIRDRLRQYLKLTAERDDLRLLRWLFRGELCNRLLPGICKSRAGTHAERVIQDDEKQATIRACRDSTHERVGKGENYQNDQRTAKSKKYEVFETMVAC